MLDINLLPKKVNELNYFKKEEQGCILYSYSQKKNVTIVCRLVDFEIEKDFCIDDKGLNMIKQLNPDTISIDDVMVIKRNKSKFTIKLLSASCPKPVLEYKSAIDVSVDKLKIANNFTATDTTKPILCGVNVDNKGTILATDSFFAFRYCDTNNFDEQTICVTIPNDFIDFIGNEFSGTIKLFLNELNCMVKKDNILYISRLIEGKYPDFSKLFDTNGSSELDFNFENFKAQIDYAKLVGENIDKNIYVILKTNTFIAIGDNEFESELKPNTDVDYEICFSFEKLSTLTDCLEKEENVVLHYFGELKPMIFDNGGNSYLLLPIRKRG